MEFSSLTSTDIVLLLVILTIVIAFAIFSIWSFTEKKKMVAVATKNMDVTLPVKINFTGRGSITTVKQIFETGMGNILFTSNEQERQNSKEDDVVVSFQPGLEAIASGVSACKVKINNRTKHSITVSAQGPLPEINPDSGNVFPDKPFNVAIIPLQAPAGTEVESFIVANHPQPEEFVVAFKFSNDEFKKL